MPLHSGPIWNAYVTCKLLIDNYYSPQLSNDIDLLDALESYSQGQEEVALSPSIPVLVTV